MNLSFLPLAESHFPLLLKWLEAPHVKKWWDQDLVYTLDLVKEKYSDYVKGYKQIDGLHKPIQAYLICLDNQPVGYIQIYNVYDFPRSKPLTGLPENLGGIDIFIGEEAFLGKGLGPQAMAKFLGLYAKDYSYVFVDPDVNNIVAIKAYEKAGFRKLSEQLTTQEIWMLWERPKALQTIQKLIKERYGQAKAVFWAGSVSSGQGTKTSDLDLVIIFDNVPYAYREAFIYDGWPVDTFVHDPATLHYFYRAIDLPSLMPALPGMIANGRLVTEDLEFGKNLQKSARELLQKKPQLDAKAFLNRRFHITDSLDDLKGAETASEFMAVKYHLYQQLAEFYLLAYGQYIGFGKQIARLLEKLNPKIADEFFHTFSKDDVQIIEQFVIKILEPFGGLLWDGFKLDAPKEWRE